LHTLQKDSRRKNPLNFFQVVIPLLTLMVLGCQSAPEPIKEAPPGWLESIPNDKAYYYAIGVSGPTPRVSDAWDQAIERARAELGRMIISQISSRGTIISSSSGEYVREIVKILSDTELNYTEVIGRWADRCGAYGPSQHFYVLVRMEKARAESLLQGIR
jgi:hypothetical protein